MKHKMCIKKHYFRFNILNYDVEKIIMELLVKFDIPKKYLRSNENVSGDDNI